MIIFFADGRLGNQMFQYAFLKTILKKDELCIVTGFEQLKEVFEIDDFILISKKNKIKRVFLNRVIIPILNLLSFLKIFSFITVDHEIMLNNYKREGTSYKNKVGLFGFITFVKLGFFQSESFFEKAIINEFSIKKDYLDTAETFLEDIPITSEKVFIHIRRGDYISHKVYGRSTLLPINYFKEKIDWFQKKNKNIVFIFLSDDPSFIKEEFMYIQNKLISYNMHFGTDLAIMTKCNSAILSPSSFGWWGSYLMKNRNIVFVPKFWLGFNSKIEYHKKPLPNYAKEVEI